MKKEMTIEEAIDILDCERPYGPQRGFGRTEKELEEALNMAIHALRIRNDYTWHLMRHCSPPESKDILVCDIDGYVYYTRQNVCDGVCRYFDTGGDELKNIVAWMPFPKAYRREE